MRRQRRRTKGDSVGPRGDRDGNRAGAAHLRAHEQLRDLSHRRDDTAAPVHDGEHPDLQFLSGYGGYGGYGRAAGSAQRPADHDDRL